MSRIFWRNFVLTVAAVVLLSGCATTTTSRYTPKFDYSPPTHAKPAGANLTFAVVGADYPELIPLFHQFGQNMSQDFFEILTARGYTVRGPFRKYDDITFPDKKGSDLILRPELQLNGDASAIQWRPNLFSALLPGTSLYTGSGNLVITGRVNFVVEESLSREKMWTKSVDIPPVIVHLAATTMYAEAGASVQMLIEKENGLYNDVARALEKQYTTILDKAYQYLDPEEMQIVKKQALEIRNKKVY